MSDRSRAWRVARGASLAGRVTVDVRGPGLEGWEDDPLGAFFRTARTTVTVYNEEQLTGYINGRPLTTLDKGRIIVPLGRAVMDFPRDFADHIRAPPVVGYRPLGRPSRIAHGFRKVIRQWSGLNPRTP